MVGYGGELHGLFARSAHLFERARMLDDQASRTGLAFVTTELAVSRRFAEAALAAFSAGYWRAHLHNSRLHLSSTNN